MSSDTSDTPRCLRALLVPSLAVGLALVAVIVQPACGRSEVEATCVAFKYSHGSTLSSGKLQAIFNPSGIPQLFEFDPPSLIVNIETHEIIEANWGSIPANRLRDILADAARELCRRTLESQISGFDFRAGNDNCNDFRGEDVQFDVQTIVDGEIDGEGQRLRWIPRVLAHAFWISVPRMRPEGTIPLPVIHSTVPFVASANSK